MVDPSTFLGDAAGGAVLAGVLAWFMSELRRVTERVLVLVEQATTAISASNVGNEETRKVLSIVATVIERCRKGGDE